MICGSKEKSHGINITHLEGKEIQLKEYDLQDNNEGLYVENSLKAEAGREVLNDLVRHINIAGLPQIGGIKNIFRKNNSRMKVTVLDQYQLILKSGRLYLPMSTIISHFSFLIKFDKQLLAQRILFLVTTRNIRSSLDC